MIVKNYLFAGLDFILGKDNKLYFIEANSSPGALKEYLKIYKHVKPVKELCSFLNKNKYKKLAVISKRKWEESIISGHFRKLFKGKIYRCSYKRNKNLLSEGDGHLIDKDGKKIMPDVVLRVAAGVTRAQEAAGIRVINPSSVLRITRDKVKAKKAVKKYTKIHVPKYFVIENKTQLKKKLKYFPKGFVFKPRTGQKTKTVYINKLPKNLQIKRSMILEQLIDCSPLFKNEFFEIRSMAVNGKYVGSMVFVSPKRPMHLWKEGRTVKTPKHLEKRIKLATEQVVQAIDKAAR
ncbi:hypothetical protein KY331_00590 [Candidatus Woesearchaeota archaeon]|nr:hypothetical protein [Candidatus Woesearchaeota archaeon]